MKRCRAVAAEFEETPTMRGRCAVRPIKRMDAGQDLVHAGGRWPRTTQLEQPLFRPPHRLDGPRHLLPRACSRQTDGAQHRHRRPALRQARRRPPPAGTRRLRHALRTALARSADALRQLLVSGLDTVRRDDIARHRGAMVARTVTTHRYDAHDAYDALALCRG
jgi:hypothetical protein